MPERNISDEMTRMRREVGLAINHCDAALYGSDVGPLPFHVFDDLGAAHDHLAAALRTLNDDPSPATSAVPTERRAERAPVEARPLPTGPRRLPKRRGRWLARRSSS